MPNKNRGRLYGAQTGISLLAYGANLTDKYWLNPKEEFVFCGNIDEESYAEGQIITPSTYEKTNFFLNPHISENFGEAMLLYKDNGIEIHDFRTPEICTDGAGKKRWIFKNGKYYIQKIISSPETYSLTKIDKRFTPNFEFKQIITRENEWPIWIVEAECVTDENTELISAYDIVCASLKKKEIWELLKENLAIVDNNTEAYNDLVDCLKKYTNDDLSKIQNFENFGFLYDTNTQKIIKPIIWSKP